MTLLRLSLALLLCGGLAFAQTPELVPPPEPAPAAAQSELSPQMLGDMLQSATTFHELVRNLNLQESLGPDVHVVDAEGRSHHSLQRTMQAMGAGAGAGAAIGALSKKDNGILIGALIGAGGGFVFDQILKQREKRKQARLAEELIDPVLVPLEIAPLEAN